MSLRRNVVTCQQAVVQSYQQTNSKNLKKFYYQHLSVGDHHNPNTNPFGHKSAEELRFEDQYRNIAAPGDDVQIPENQYNENNMINNNTKNNSSDIWLFTKNSIKDDWKFEEDEELKTKPVVSFSENEPNWVENHKSKSVTWSITDEKILNDIKWNANTFNSKMFEF